jgi:hypothetical protein
MEPGFPCFGSAHPNGIREVPCEIPNCNAAALSLVWMRLSDNFERDVHLRLCADCTAEARKNAPKVLALATARDVDRAEYAATVHTDAATRPKGGRRAKTKAAVAVLLAGKRFSS